MYKKLIFTMMLLLGVIQTTSAQTSVEGKVTDKKGNPIPGAKVEVPGTNESVLTELDGTFSLTTQQTPRWVNVYYVGMQPKKQVVSPEMVIKLTKTNWWNKIPNKPCWFVNAQVAIPESGSPSPAFGLMLGRFKTAGWYVKGVYSANPSSDVDYNADYWTTGKSKHGYMAFTAGAIFRLGCALHFYGGAGYAERKMAWELYDGRYEDCPDDTYSGAALDYGLMLRAGSFLLNAGGIYTFGGDNAASVGIGLCF